MKKRTQILLGMLSVFTFSFYGCEKNVTVEIPQAEELIVVEGYIETGTPPILLLTKSLPFFGEINVNNILQNSVLGATVIIDNGTIIDTLDQIPGYGVYTTSQFVGEIGKTYKLTVLAEGKTLTSVTSIPNPVPLDSTWWKVDGQRDSLGFLWGHLTDPDTLNNCYRFFAKRINKYTYGANIGEVKDSIFYPPVGGSVFEDRYINGRSFDLSFPRGKSSTSDKEDDKNVESFFFKRGDTIVVKFCAIDRAHFEFWRTEESQVSSNGNPFGSPQPVHTNITGGLGIWGGYSTTFDTVIAQ
jgi:hypothetical protein